MMLSPTIFDNHSDSMISQPTLLDTEGGSGMVPPVNAYSNNGQLMIDLQNMGPRLYS